MDERRKAAEFEFKRSRSSRHDVQPPTSSSESQWDSQGHPYYRSRSPKYIPQNWNESIYTPQYLRDLTNPPPYNSHSDSLQPFGFPAIAAPQRGQCTNSHILGRADSGSKPKATQKNAGLATRGFNSGEAGAQRCGEFASFSELFGGYRSPPQYIEGYPEQQPGSSGYANRVSTLPVSNSRECPTPGYTNRECPTPGYVNRECPTPGYANRECPTPGYTNKEYEAPVYPHQGCASPIYPQTEYGAPVYFSQEYGAAVYSNQQDRAGGYQQWYCATGYSSQQYYGTGGSNPQYGCPSLGGGKNEAGGQQDKGNGSANGTPLYFGGQRDFIQSSVNLHQSGGLLSGHISQSSTHGGYGILSDYSANTGNPLQFFSGSQQETDSQLIQDKGYYKGHPDRESIVTSFGFPGWSWPNYEELGRQSPRFSDHSNESAAIEYPEMPPTPPYPIDNPDNPCAHDVYSACYCSVHYTNKLHHDDAVPHDLNNFPPLNIEDILLTQRFLNLGSTPKKAEGG